MFKAAVITFPGSNCDDDLRYALSQTEFDVSEIWHKDTPNLNSYDLVCVPGGFSYGDYLRCGAMAALSPVMGKVKEYATAGNLLLGICNGFQILCEAQLLPGALIRNESQNFICKDVVVRTENCQTPWTNGFNPNETVTLPIAHGEGRYLIDDATYLKLKSNGQILFTYAENPNGSFHSIAGVCNEQKNVFALMPHPERATDLRSKDGMKLWSSIRNYLSEKKQ